MSKRLRELYDLIGGKNILEFNNTISEISDVNKRLKMLENFREIIEIEITNKNKFDELVEKIKELKENEFKMSGEEYGKQKDSLIYLFDLSFELIKESHFLFSNYDDYQETYNNLTNFL